MYMTHYPKLAQVQKMAKQRSKPGNPSPAAVPKSPPGFAEEKAQPQPRPSAGEGRWILNIGADGRVVIPAAARAAMQLGETGKVTAMLENGELRLISPRVAIARLQALVKKLDKGTGSIVDELIAERRAEALKE